ncbi:uncharacterized protein LOC132943868 [Metopolophium dirhodum]|uniref:uncharacterized protein LOC132943868 n=1 Tax=Metopolophium dirhodum TaxID=44670 RepID=UPI00298FDCDD|nr:uncharacterized protein LOC132943868 [Metopolophium dirhodum]
MPMINYFEDTWIGRPNRRNGRRPPMFSVNMWNCYESVIQDLPRTNNSVEGWHHAFNAALGANHVSIWKFIRFLKHEQLLQEVRLEKRLSGEASPTRRRKYRDHDKKIKVIVENYSEIPTVQYLRGLSYNVQY